MNLFSTIWMRRVTLHRQFCSYQMTKYVKLLFKEGLNGVVAFTVNG